MARSSPCRHAYRPTRTPLLDGLGGLQMHPVTHGWLEAWLAHAPQIDFVFLVVEITEAVTLAKRSNDLLRLAELLIAIDSCLREWQRRARALR